MRTSEHFQATEHLVPVAPATSKEPDNRFTKFTPFQPTPASESGGPERQVGGSGARTRIGGMSGWELGVGADYELQGMLGSRLDSHFHVGMTGNASQAHVGDGFVQLVRYTSRRFAGMNGLCGLGGVTGRASGR